MVDMLPTAAPELAIYTKWVLDAKLAELGVKVKVNHKITEMTDQHIICDCQGETYAYEGDSVICALGLKPNRTLVDELREKCGKTEIIPVGDVNKPSPGIPRAEKGGILDPLKVLDGREKTGNRVIVCGAGLVGCEVAMVLADRAKTLPWLTCFRQPRRNLQSIRNGY